MFVFGFRRLEDSANPKVPSTSSLCLSLIARPASAHSSSSSPSSSSIRLLATDSSAAWFCVALLVRCLCVEQEIWNSGEKGFFGVRNWVPCRMLTCSSTSSSATQVASLNFFVLGFVFGFRFLVFWFFVLFF